MTHSLPDDLEKWPSSPYAILGISPSADKREIKLAYTRLIRTYKPDFYPAEFRKIREAYDSLLQRQDSNSSSPTFPRRNKRPGRTDSYQQPQHRTSTDEPSLELRETESLQERYRKLRELIERGQLSTSVYRQVYWILKLRPELDESRDRLDYLSDGLTRLPDKSSLISLYLDELKRSESEIRSERCTAIISSIPPGRQLMQILELRWKEDSEHWHYVSQDLDRLRERIAKPNAMFWFELLVSAAKSLAFLREPAARSVADRVHSEIDEYWEFHIERSELLDAFDLVPELTAAIESSGPIHNHPIAKAIADAIPIVWRNPHEETPELTALTRIIADDQTHAYTTLVELSGTTEFKLALGLIAQTLNTWFRRRIAANASGETETANRVLEFIHRSAKNPTDFMSAVGDICLREGLLPSDVADIIEQDRDGPRSAQAAADAIRNDRVFEFVSLSESLARHRS